jgi:peroxiredoxin/outer membrane lipoprotein-sorting protein
MGSSRLLVSARFSAGSVVFLLTGLGWGVLSAFAEDASADAISFADEPAAHKLYDQMMEAIQKAESLSYVSRYEREAQDRFRSACSYRVCLKKPNYFRMETHAISGEQGGVLIGDGNRLWIYWPRGRPQWEYVEEAEADAKTRFTSYMTKPAPQGKHSILHEAIFLGAGMSLPILDSSTFHGHVDSIEKHLDAVRSKGLETIAGEECDLIEVSLMDHQRSWYLWLAKRDHLPRQLKEIARIGYDVVTHEKWSDVTVNADIPDSRFSWKPPADWHEWRLPSDDDSLIKPGSKAPEFDLASVDGKRARLSDYKGKKVWLCFWRVGCPPCREEMPFLQDVYAKHKDEGFVVLGVNVSDDQAITRDFLRKQRITFPNILDTSQAAVRFSTQEYGSGTAPLNYLIDGDGLVVDAWFGHCQTRAEMALKKLGIKLPEPVR